MNKTLSTLILALSIPGVAMAQEQSTMWQCQVDGLERRVELNEAMTASPVCDVWYDKSAEGGAKMRLWAADNDSAYCRPKAEQLIASLESWGWSCELFSSRQEP